MRSHGQTRQTKKKNNNINKNFIEHNTIVSDFIAI